MTQTVFWKEAPRVNGWLLPCQPGERADAIIRFYLDEGEDLDLDVFFKEAPEDSWSASRSPSLSPSYRHIVDGDYPVGWYVFSDGSLSAYALDEESEDAEPEDTQVSLEDLIGALLTIKKVWPDADFLFS